MPVTVRSNKAKQQMENDKLTLRNKEFRAENSKLRAEVDSEKAEKLQLRSDMDALKQAFEKNQKDNEKMQKDYDEIRKQFNAQSNVDHGTGEQGEQEQCSEVQENESSDIDSVNPQPAPDHVTKSSVFVSRIKLPEPPVYSGLSSEDASLWLRDMETYHSFNQLKDDRQLALHFVSRLAGEPKTWFYRQEAHVQKSYGKMVKLFTTRYVTVDLQTTFYDLSQLKLNTAKDWDDLVYRHAQICDRMGFTTEQQRVDSFKNCLPPDVAAFVRYDKFDDVRELARKAKSIHSIGLPKRGIAVNAVEAQPQGYVSEYSNGRGRGGQFSGRGRGNTSQPRRFPCAVCGSYDHQSYKCPMSFENRKSHPEAEAKFTAGLN